MSPCSTPKPRVGIVNYGAGNIGNVVRAIQKLDFEHALLEHTADIGMFHPTLLLLPGVGAFRPAAERLASTGWTETLKRWAADGRPLLGICIGMQLLCAQSSEDGMTAGLGLLEGDVEKLSGVSKIPHMGWNRVIWRDDAPGAFFADNRRSETFYFVHSYAVADSPHCIGTTGVDEATFCAALRNKNVAGFQFHPERSGPDGIAFLGRTIDFLNAAYPA